MKVKGYDPVEFEAAPAILRPTVMHGVAAEAGTPVAPLLSRAVALLRCFTQAEYTLSAKDLVERSESRVQPSTAH